jgi:hypothetical protein
LLQVKSSPNGTAILRAINKEMTNLVPVTDADYDSVREIRRVLEAEWE